MKKPNLSQFIKDVRVTMVKHSPEILTGLGIGGLVTTTILAVRATPKALRLIEEKKRQEHLDELTPIETVKTTWKCYVPAAIIGTTSIACIIGATSVNMRRNAALATAYKISETALSEYKEKVIETIGEKKEQTVKDKVAEKRLKENPVNKNSVIVTKKGNTLCYDHWSGRYFYSDRDQIVRAVNELNRRMLSEGYISLNELYDALELDHIPVGYELGWNIDRGLIELDLGSHLNDEGTPCLVLDYTIAPRQGYSKFA